MDYTSKLNEAKADYPFERWRASAEHGLDQYTEANCQRAKSILDTLIGELAALGENAPEDEKAQRFEIAVEALNDLNEETEECLIESGERDELCALFDAIGIKAGLNPANYGAGEGIASEWRDW